MLPKRLIITLIILLTGAGLNFYFSKPAASLPRKPLAEFPRVLGDWTAGEDQLIDEQSMKILLVDDYLVRTYRKPSGESINLYIGYFQVQREGKGIHSPRQCLPGSGWLPVDSRDYMLPVPDHNPAAIEVNKYLMGKGLDRQLFLFWYQGRGRAYAGEYWNKLYLVWDGMRMKRTDGALIRVSSPVRTSPEQALKTQTEFVHLFYPRLSAYIPD
jgi:EpsI family protein